MCITLLPTVFRLFKDQLMFGPHNRQTLVTLVMQLESERDIFGYAAPNHGDISISQPHSPAMLGYLQTIH